MALYINNSKIKDIAMSWRLKLVMMNSSNNIFINIFIYFKQHYETTAKQIQP